ncbi:hypothetical protein [Mesorhizobium sp. WSM3859]|uniref:hypothetical protein n=1 Tax=Mesorhizobium sp. WSM3859 TaxID=2029402 RepID=UPI001FE0F67A|nr:hypothetical protein [Mesorhizobium sp. WSM3859]
MTIDDAGHYSPEQRAAIIAAFRTSSSRWWCEGSSRLRIPDRASSKSRRAMFSEPLEEPGHNAYLWSNPKEV